MYNLINLVTSNKEILILTFLIVSIDFITGVTKAFKNSTFSSEKFKKSLTKFIIYGCAILLAGIFDVIFNIELIELTTKITINGAVSTLVIIFIIVTEASSIVENFKDMGYNIPVLSKIVKEKQEELNNDIEYNLEDVVDDLDEIEEMDNSYYPPSY